MGTLIAKVFGNTIGTLGSLKVLVNEDTLLPAQMFLRLPAPATFVADTHFVSGTQKMFLILFRNIFVSATNVSQFAQPKYENHDGNGSGPAKQKV